MKRFGAITHPYLTVVLMVKGSVLVPLKMSHFVMKKSQDGDEVVRAPKPGKYFPKSFTIDAVEGLVQVNEGHD